MGISEALMEQALIGPSPNPLILSYLKYAINSQVRTNAVLQYNTILFALALDPDTLKPKYLNLPLSLLRWCLILVS